MAQGRKTTGDDPAHRPGGSGSIGGRPRSTDHLFDSLVLGHSNLLGTMRQHILKRLAPDGCTARPRQLRRDSPKGGCLVCQPLPRLVKIELACHPSARWGHDAI